MRASRRPGGSEYGQGGAGRKQMPARRRMWKEGKESVTRQLRKQQTTKGDGAGGGREAGEDKGGG
eukprot:750977-Hanusia_phi.AAC.4